MRFSLLKKSAALFTLLMTMQAGSLARDWVAIDDVLFMDPHSITQQGALQKVTVKLKGEVHEILIYCKKRALLFNEEMIAASETPAGTSLVAKVCDAPKKWYEGWK